MTICSFDFPDNVYLKQRSPMEELITIGIVTMIVKAVLPKKPPRSGRSRGRSRLAPATEANAGSVRPPILLY
jgi:hypothetical protein